MDKMPEGLRELAENVSEWPENSYYGAWLSAHEGQKFVTRFFGWPELLKPFHTEAYTRDQWQSARQQLADERMDNIACNGNDGDHYGVMTESEEQDYGTKPRSKYHVEISPGVWVDVYDVLHAFRVINPGDQHALKKLLKPGQRGYKDANQDRREAMQSIERAIELEDVK